ncbi:MAG: hypothetical protein JETCAE01_16210 [Anaerolineaceae bacterium]|nr:MAG: hypothetical protein JETCAE01_16210 [Anaerolineaceae bacterium]
MNFKKMLLLIGVLVVASAVFAACGTGPQGPEGPAGPAGPQGEPGPAAVSADLSCTECHNDTAIITSKKASWQESLHGQGVAFIDEGGNNRCAFCHSGAAFSQAIAEGKNFSEVESGDANPTHQDCRTCHQIHVTYTGEDWALETDAPVTTVTSGATFDGGSGNLCANCHQARRYLANFVATDAAGNSIEGKYTPTIRFNTHYSVQVDTLLGTVDVNEALGVEGKEAAHYSKVEDTCVGCHMGGGETANHRFLPQVATCAECHTDAESFDINGSVTAFEAKVEELKAALVAKGLMNEDGTNVLTDAAGNPVQLDPPQAAALFVYHLIEEDGSESIHNPVYFNALVDASLEALK